MSSDYDELSLDLTEEDLAEMDAIVSQSYRKCSPMATFRPSGVLSVTDLCAPAWCEVQYDYGIRQRRHLRVDQRPPSLVTANGREILVENSLAIANERTTTAGKTIHRALERQIHPEEVILKPRTGEDRWGVRLINMLLGLKALRSLGQCREFPVFGLIHGHLVLGVIDQIEQQGERGNAKEQRSGTAFHKQQPIYVGQVSIEKYFRKKDGRVDSELANHTEGQRNTKPIHELVLRLTDTKTRRSPGLPAHTDTLPSRLQLMLYKRLLTPLLCDSATFDFSTTLATTGIDLCRPFSNHFITEISLLAQAAGLWFPASAATNLETLIQIWRASVASLSTGIVSVSDELRLVYYRQASHSAEQKQKPPTNSESGSPAPLITERDDGSQTDERLAEVKNLIGSKKFKYAPQLLESHLQSILTWWIGERPPTGVALESVGRCRTCEYQNGCEWLETKAFETIQEMNIRRPS